MRRTFQQVLLAVCVGAGVAGCDSMGTHRRTEMTLADQDQQVTPEDQRGGRSKRPVPIPEEASRPGEKKIAAPPPSGDVEVDTPPARGQPSRDAE